MHVSLFVHSFFGASLVALKKKDEGTSIRPIAVGCTLHRLVTKCAGSKVMKKIDELLFPKQLGYGIKRGIEIAIHSARVYLSNHFKNAFNTIQCSWQLKILPLVCFLLFILCTVHHLPCFVGQKLFSLQKGCSRVTLSRTSCLTTDVYHDLQLITKEAHSLGLQLNYGKSGIISNNTTIIQAMLTAVPGLQVTEPRCTTLLGTPFGDIASISAAICAKRILFYF